MNDDVKVQIRSTVLEGLGKRKAMFMPMVCVSSFMLVGYAALDTTAPEIVTESLDLELNEEVTPEMIQAVDNKDDRSAITITVDQSADYDATREGTYYITVTATDSFNNVSEEKVIPVTYSDKKAPVISVKDGVDTDANVIKLRYNSDANIREYIQAIDNNINSGNQGDLTEYIVQENELDTSTLGSQIVNVSVKDDAGNETKKAIPVYIIDDVAPDLQLADDGEARINYGSQFDLSEFAKAIDEYEGDLTDQIEIVEQQLPDTNTLGATGYVNLKVADSSGNVTEKTLNLTVADTEAPTITFSRNNFSVKMGDTVNVADYVSVSDNLDQDIGSKVTYSANTVDTSSEGKQTITVSATDEAGNTTTETFTVTVYDPATYAGNTVVSTAATKVGCAYVYGGSGPNVFDCSGLTQWAYRQAGISIPRTATAQYYGASQHLYSYSELQPGDLLFFNTQGTSYSHVGIYVGNGMMIHAGSESTGVNRTSIYGSYWTSRFTGAGRYY